MLSLVNTLTFLRKHALLITLGLTCELCYLLYFVRQFPLLRYYQGLTDMGHITQYTHSGFTLFVLMFTLLFVLFGCAWWEIRRFQDRSTFWLVFAFGALFALTMIFVYPATAIDVFIYIAHSLVLVQYHANPMITPAAHFPNDPVLALAGGWGCCGAPYGPLGILVNAIPSVLVGRNVLANLLLLKFMYSSLLLVESFLVYKILYRFTPQFALVGALFIAWNPYALFEFSANSHNDVVMMLFVLLAILALLEQRLALSCIIITISMMVKYASLPLVPLFFFYGLVHQTGWRERILFLERALGGSILVVVIFFLPFWSGPGTLNNLLYQDQRYMASFSTMLTDLTSSYLTRDQGKLIGRLLYSICYLYALYLTTRQDKTAILRAFFIAMFGFLALGTTNFEIWYALWPLLLAALIPRLDIPLAALLMAYGASISVTTFDYLWVWLGVNNQNLSLINNLAYMLSFVPASLLLLSSMLRSLLTFRKQAEVA